MLSILFSLSPILLMLYSLILIKRRQSIKTDLLKGVVCYHCHTKMIDLNDLEKLFLAVSGKDNLTLCKSCDREIKIQSLNNKYYYYKNKFNRFLISGKFIRTATIIIVLSLVIDLLLIQGHVAILSTTFNIIYWLLVLLNIKLTTVPKNSLGNYLNNIK